MWNFVGFQEKHRQDSHNIKIDTFYRLPDTSAQCIKGAENYPEAGILVNYDIGDYSEGYDHFNEAFGARTKDDVLPPLVSDPLLNLRLPLFMFWI